MPKSLPRRVKRLERSTAEPGGLPTASDLLEFMERLGRSPKLSRPAGFDEAWGEYIAARDAVGPDWTNPPDGFRPHLDGPTRVRLWQRWDCPPVAPSVDRLLQLVAEWGTPLPLRNPK